MKVGIYTDVHVSVNSSILSGSQGSIYSKRLDSIVKTFEWMYKLFADKEVGMIIDAGDLNDSDLLTAEENSALSKCFSYKSKYAPDIPEYHILGNHEKKSKSYLHNSISLLNNYDNITVVDKPLKVGNISLLPYTNDYDNHGVLQELKNDILISHAEYLGLSYNNAMVMNHGFPPDYSLENFKLIFNGHLHTAGNHYDNRLINIGSLIGSNFSDSYYNYRPGIIILDTETLEFERIENPYSPLFIKLSADTISSLMSKLDNLSDGRYYCIKTEVPFDLRDSAREVLDKYSSSGKVNILASRVHGIVTKSSIIESKEQVESIMATATPQEALCKFLGIQTDLPAETKDVLDFVEEYLK